MKEFNIKEFKNYLKAENINKDTIEQFAGYIEDFVTYGKRKPYMPINEFIKQFDEKIKLFKILELGTQFAYLTKLTSNQYYSWKKIKYKLNCFFDDLKNGGELPSFSYTVWTYAKNDIEYEVYLLINFNKSISPDLLKQVICNAWYSLENCCVNNILSTDQVVDCLIEIKDRTIQNAKNGFTPHLKSSKLFITGEIIPVDNDLNKTEDDYYPF